MVEVVWHFYHCTVVSSMFVNFTLIFCDEGYIIALASSLKNVDMFPKETDELPDMGCLVWIE